MQLPPIHSRFDRLVAAVLGVRGHRFVRAGLEVPVALLADPAPTTTSADAVSRAELAMSLAAVLFDDLCARVPDAAAYVRERAAVGERVVFDHGAVRSVAAPCGALPGGRRSIARLLEPLGYVERRRYDLDGLGMTGYAYTHADLPADVPQFFVSELHPERFSPAFARAVEELVATSVDPLTSVGHDALFLLERDAFLPFERATQLLHELRHAFERQHRTPTLTEYELLLAESAEMAWIATEGHAFNHITDRVADVAAVAREQRALGRPVKDELEVSGSGRVVQTALRAARVERLFQDEGRFLARTVAGSFLEFISRAHDEHGALDLAFDAANAQGIFRMTDDRRTNDQSGRNAG